MQIAVTILGPRSNPHLAAFEPAAKALHDALRQLGHACYLRRDGESADWSQYDRAVVLGAIHAPSLGFELPDNAVVYNLEQVGSAWFGDSYRRLLNRLPWWDYNTSNASRAQHAYGLLDRSAVVPLGDVAPSALAELGRDAPITDADYPIDVAFVGWLNKRRREVIDHMRYLGLRVEVIDGTGPLDYSHRRRGVLTNCKLLVNVHFYPAAIFESSRAAYALANGVPMLSERGAEVDLWACGPVVFDSFEALPEAAVRLVRNPEQLTAMAELGRAELLANAPRYLEQVRAALASLPPLAAG